MDTGREEITMALQMLFECASNCEADLVGEHREFYNPRISKAFTIFARRFPVEVGRAMLKSAGEENEQT